MQLQSPHKVYSGSAELNAKPQGASRYLNIQDNLIQQSLRDSEPINKLGHATKPQDANEGFSFVQQSAANDTLESPAVLKSIGQMHYSEKRLLTSSERDREQSSKLKSQFARPISNLNMLDRQSSSSLFQPTAAQIMNQRQESQMKSSEEMIGQYAKPISNTRQQDQIKIAGGPEFQSIVKSSYENVLGTKAKLDPNDFGNF